MAKLQQDVEPAEVGLDADRLSRIEAHFAPLVDAGRFPGFLVLVSRGGRVPYLATYGWRDIATRRPVELDTLFRIYSMTKPITSVAAMMLYEEGRFRLDEPVATYLPEFASPQVYVSGSSISPVLRPASAPIRIWHLLTHTAGLTYGFLYQHAVDAIYRSHGYEWGAGRGVDLAGAVEGWAGMPLLFEPGTSWNYSVATDVVGRLVEVLSGQRLDEYLSEHVFGPLGMDDTGFHVPEADLDRLASLYSPSPADGKAVANTAMDGAVRRPPRFLSGGGGLVSSAGDYHRFAQMLLRGGELDGVRLLGPRTLAFMTENHLPGGHDLAWFGHPISGEPDEGIGFGLGFSVTLDPVGRRCLSSAGEFSWGGAASTTFWVDPAEDLTVIWLTQLLPSSTIPVKPRLQPLVYQSIVD